MRALCEVFKRQKRFAGSFPDSQAGTAAACGRSGLPGVGVGCAEEGATRFARFAGALYFDPSDEALRPFPLECQSR